MHIWEIMILIFIYIQDIILQGKAAEWDDAGGNNKRPSDLAGFLNMAPCTFSVVYCSFPLGMTLRLTVAKIPEPF
jgi:hypothetical protein